MTITVVNKYKEPNHVYCGRGSPLGNPFYMNGEHMRVLVVSVYLNGAIVTLLKSIWIVSYEMV